MSSSVPNWLYALQPIHEPSLERLSRHSSASAWHVQVEFTPWRVPSGMLLTGKQTWNGKALIVPADSHLDASVGEVEVAQRLRLAFPTRSSYWTAGSGHPPQQWRDWALTPALHQQEPWLLELDQRIRDADAALQGNRRGWPDVVSWESGTQDLLCAEYKGPVTSHPDTMDSVSPEQDAWFRAAIRQDLLDVDRYAVVSWCPSSVARPVLLEQAAARRSPATATPVRVEPRKRDANQSQAVAPHAEGALHRRTIRKVLKQRLGVKVVSHIDGTIDVHVPPSPDVAAFRDQVEREVSLLGYLPTIEVVSNRPGNHMVRVSTPETLEQRGQGAHRV